ncbi:MAG: 2-oxo acid dehydrogenase subunit E2 [Gammaproteobacteria bacterium]|nr:2-oxo acid dehydrogenase subunit E2 [Gammaproteobacteria bacterium]
MGTQGRELRIPELGEGTVEGTVVAVLVAPGATVEAGQSLIEVETDKVTMEVPAECAGRILELTIEVGQTVAPGLRFASIDATAEEIARAVPEAAASGAAAIPASVAETAVRRPNERLEAANTAVFVPAAAPPRILPAGPAARREARELGVDLGSVQGTGPRQRISREDVRRHVRRALANGPAAQPVVEPLPDLAAFGPVHSEPLARIAQTTAKNMVRSATLIPHAWVQVTADGTALDAARRDLRRAQADGEAPLTLSVLVVRAVAKVLAAHPRINAAYDAQSQSLILRDYVNVGLAVATPRGLVVPVVRDPLAKDLKALAADVDELVRGARDQKLPLRAYQGAGFTISNLGGHGVDSLQPIVNWPEVAILGVGAIVEMPRVIDGQVAIRRCLSLTLGFDHRVINGAEAAGFLGAVKAELENPLRLAM